MNQGAEISFEKTNNLIKDENVKFDLDIMLNKAMDCFYSNGYHSTSVESLTKAMGVNESELVVAFGDKHALFEAVLASYSHAIISEISARLDDSNTPLDAIRTIFSDVVKITIEDTNHRGCMVTNSVIEFGGKDQVITEAIQRTINNVEDSFYRALTRAHELGQLDKSRDARSLARFIVSTIQGIRVVGQTTSDPEVINDIAKTAIRCL